MTGHPLRTTLDRPYDGAAGDARTRRDAALTALGGVR